MERPVLRELLCCVSQLVPVLSDLRRCTRKYFAGQATVPSARGVQGGGCLRMQLGVAAPILTLGVPTLNLGLLL